MICAIAHRWTAMKTLLLLTCLVATPVFAASGVMLKGDDLRSSASASAAGIGRLDKGAAVQILGRQGGWTQVSDGSRTGWVRILSVRSTDTASAGAGLTGLLEAGGKRSDSGRVVATAGLRGLSEEDLKAAHFDAAELTKMERYQVDRAGAEQFSRTAGLQHRDLAYLPAPQREKTQDKNQASPWGDGGPP